LSYLLNNISFVAFHVASISNFSISIFYSFYYYSLLATKSLSKVSLKIAIKTNAIITIKKYKENITFSIYIHIFV